MATEMRRYNWAVISISETHWTKARQKRLDSGEMLSCSGHEDENAQRTKEVSLTPSKEVRKASIGLESYGSRIIKSPFITKKEGITIDAIHSYAPTTDSNEEDKGQFNEATVGRKEVTGKEPDHSDEKPNR